MEEHAGTRAARPASCFVAATRSGDRGGDRSGDRSGGRSRPYSYGTSLSGFSPGSGVTLAGCRRISCVGNGMMMPALSSA